MSRTPSRKRAPNLWALKDWSAATGRKEFFSFELADAINAAGRVPPRNPRSVLSSWSDAGHVRPIGEVKMVGRSGHVRVYVRYQVVNGVPSPKQEVIAARNRKALAAVNKKRQRERASATRHDAVLPRKQGIAQVPFAGSMLDILGVRV